MTERKFFPVYHFEIKGGWRQRSEEYGKGYIQAIKDVKRLNHLNK